MYLWLTQCMNHVMVGTSDAATSDDSVPRPSAAGVYDVTVSSNTGGDHVIDSLIVYTLCKGLYSQAC